MPSRPPAQPRQPLRSGSAKHAAAVPTKSAQDANFARALEADVAMVFAVPRMPISRAIEEVPAIACASVPQTDVPGTYQQQPRRAVRKYGLDLRLARAM